MIFALIVFAITVMIGGPMLIIRLEDKERMVCMARSISKHDGLKIIAGRGPKGLFYYLDGDKYIGIDNTTGDAWTEEFKSIDDCLKWLKGDDEDD